MNHAWQYYQTTKFAIAFEQFCLLNPLLQFCLQNNYLLHFESKMASSCCNSSTPVSPLGTPFSCVLVTRWLIYKMLHNTQDKFTKEAAHLWGLPLILFNLARQLRLFLVQVLSLWTMILIGRMLPIILLLTIIQLIDLHLLLAYGPNLVRARILMNSWPTYLVDLLILLTLIRPPVLILIYEELKLASLTLSVALSLTSLIISCSNVTYISMLTWCNSTWTVWKSTLQ